MAKNKNKKNQQKRAKAQKRRRDLAKVPVTTDQKISRVRASAYPDESLEDRAVFDDFSRAKLPKEMTAQVNHVRKALDYLAGGRDAAAESTLADIPRRSPMSDWRLFVRGLIAWYAGQTDSAGETFSRLDPERRPARIAETLRHSEEMNVACKEKSAATDSPAPIAHAAGLDQAIFSGASLVHRIRSVRPALAEARREIVKKERLPDLDGLEIPDEFPGPRKMSWLTEFATNNQRHEPEFANDLFENVFRHLFHLPLGLMLEDFTKHFPGPAHDPQNLLRQTLYYGKFEDGDEEANAARKKYLDSLRKITTISKPVAAALAAEVHLNAARDEQAVGGGYSGMPMSMFGFGPTPDERAIQKHFVAATKACPSHAEAHEEHIDWIESELETPRLAKTREKKLHSDLSIAMSNYSRGCPEEIDPRLWLVDHYLEEEKLELAEPHVQWLAGSRNTDLRVRATQWKWHLLESMRLCRRKAWLSQVDEQLDAADKLWPAWLSKDWLPYFRAARALRAGDLPAYELIRKQIRDSWGDTDSEHLRLTDAAAMLGAAQRMRVPAADLKPLRKPIEELVKDPGGLSNVELIRAGRFFTEMLRAGLAYPAYRMHGGKFAEELAFRLVQNEIESNETKDADFWPAMFWLAYQRSFVDSNRGIHVPNMLTHLDAPEKVAAIIVQTSNTGNRRWPSAEAVQAVSALEPAIAKEKDVYLKYWYGTLVEKAKEKHAQSSGPSFRGGMFERLQAMMAGLGDKDDDDDDVDLQCDCPSCTATRARLGIPQPWE